MKRRITYRRGNVKRSLKKKTTKKNVEERYKKNGMKDTKAVEKSSRLNSRRSINIYFLSVSNRSRVQEDGNKIYKRTGEKNAMIESHGSTLNAISGERDILSRRKSVVTSVTPPRVCLD